MVSHPHLRQPVKKKNFTQSFGLVVGFLLVVLALSGLQFPAFAGLHLNFIHSLITLVTGVLLFWHGYKDFPTREAFITCLVFATFYGLLAVIGFTFGREGMPGIGYQRFDQNLLVIIPNFIEFGTSDHILNGIISLLLFGVAIGETRIGHEGSRQTGLPRRPGSRQQRPLPQ